LSSSFHEEILIERHRNTPLRLLTDPLTHIGIAKRVITTLLFRIRRLITDDRCQGIGIWLLPFFSNTKLLHLLPLIDTEHPHG
jgi:hypothetical protein